MFNFTTKITDWLKDNRWLVLVFIVVAAAAAVVFVSNVRSINGLLVQKRDLEKVANELRDKNKRLQSQVIHLQSADRIINYATEELDMVTPDVAPQVIE
ncbi:MAG: cell division protein FtsL [Desulfobulbaceae bacterium]|nr:cell division protein FtsL [Candidatus Kapabacteria bacterium]MBS4000322.1 cell division protein FtsL [Desulfobulbaceae bacterium]